MAEYTGNSYVAKQGTTALGIIGTVLGGLAVAGGNAGNLGWNNQNTQYVSRETFDLQNELIRSERQNAILSADLNTEKKMVEVYNSLNDKINRIVSDQAAINSAQAVTNTAVTSNIAVMQNNINQLMGLTKLVVPNTSVCPGWGNVTITPATQG